MMFKIGDKVMCRPVTICATDGDNTRFVKVRDMVGVVEYINDEHGWYRVVFETPGGPIRECFFENELC